MKTERELRVGDVVDSVHETWGPDFPTIETIAYKSFTEPIAFFVDGGFWRLSRLKLADATALEKIAEEGSTK